MGGGQLDHARLIQRRAVQLSLVVSVSAAIALLAAGPAIISVWTRGLVDSPRALLAVLVLVVVANSFWFTLTTSLVATNRHVRMAVVYLGSTAVAVLLAIPLSSAFGSVGGAVSLLAIDLAMSAYVLPSALRVVGDSPNAFLRALLDVNGVIRSIRLIRRSG
jgi:O-antigen/teichoic acid export membrane protein